MAGHVIENARCVPGVPYGEWRCDLPSSSSEFSSEYFSSAEISSEEISSEFVSSEGSPGPAPEISSLEASSAEEAPSEEISSPVEISSVVPEQPSSAGPGPQPPQPPESSGLSSDESLLPCVPSGRCEEVSCFEGCSVQIRQVLTDVYSCPPSSDDRAIILWFYTPEEIAQFCQGHGAYCDFVAYTETACDEISHVAILYFDVCCGCPKPSS
jgi:hypothetical protein